MTCSSKTEKERDADRQTDRVWDTVYSVLKQRDLLPLSDTLLFVDNVQRFVMHCPQVGVMFVSPYECGSLSLSLSA